MSTMPKYVVTTMIQSADIDNNEPVQVRWYTGDSLGQAIAALASAAAHHEEVDARVPAVARYSTLSVTLNIEQEMTPAPLKVWCNSHEGEHTFTDGSDGDTPCIGWRTEADMVRATPSTEADMVRATPSTEGFDCETVAYALSDCAYWNTPDEECAGPWVGVVIATDDILCEKHFNHPPQ